MGKQQIMNVLLPRLSVQIAIQNLIAGRDVNGGQSDAS